jgi:integrase
MAEDFRSDIEDSTRDGYNGYIDRVIKPTLGDVAVNKIGVRELESVYATLRLCRTRCDGKPFIAKHQADGEHDCVLSKRELHKCSPMAASTVRQIHSIISGVARMAGEVPLPCASMLLG